MKKYLPKVLSWIVAIALIVAVFIYFNGTEKKTNAKELYIENIRNKYEIDEEESYDYYYGFDAGVRWAKNHSETTVSGTSYESDISEASYNKGYEAGYKSAQTDYEAQIFSLKVDFNNEIDDIEDIAYKKGYEEGEKYGIYITDVQNRADYVDRYQEGYKDGYEDGAAGKPMWQGF